MITKQGHLTIQIILVVLSLTNVSLVRAQKQSRVHYFEYGGLGDNVNGYLNGYLFYSTKTSTNSDTLLPLSGVIVTVFSNKGKLIKSLLTDKDGNFQIESPNGLYNLLISKKRYQPIKITDYASMGDQVSTIEIVLEKGATTQHYKIPTWTDVYRKVYISDSTK